VRGGAVDRAQERILERDFGGSNASATAASDQPPAHKSRTRSLNRAEEDRVDRYALSLSGSLCFIDLIVSLVEQMYNTDARKITVWRSSSPARSADADEERENVEEGEVVQTGEVVH